MIAIFGKSIPQYFFPQMKEIIETLETQQQPYSCYESVYKYLENNNIKTNGFQFNSFKNLPQNTNILLSI